MWIEIRIRVYKSFDEKITFGFVLSYDLLANGLLVKRYSNKKHFKLGQCQDLMCTVNFKDF